MIRLHTGLPYNDPEHDLIPVILLTGSQSGAGPELVATDRERLITKRVDPAECGATLRAVGDFRLSAARHP